MIMTVMINRTWFIINNQLEKKKKQETKQNRKGYKTRDALSWDRNPIDFALLEILRHIH